MKKSTKKLFLVFTILISWLGIYASAHAQTFSVDNHSSNFSIVAGQFQDMLTITDMITPGDQTCISDTFYGWACQGAHPTSPPEYPQPYFVDLSYLNSIPAGNIIYFCEGGTICPDDAIAVIALSVIATPPATISAGSVQALVVRMGEDFGLSLLAIVGAFLGIAVCVLIFKTGWRYLRDESFTLGGYYLRKLPYRGYHRFRSKKWNAEHS